MQEFKRFNQNIYVISGDKDSSVIIIDKNDYINKLESTINEGINKGAQVQTTDNTLKDLELFQSFFIKILEITNFMKKCD